MPPGERARRQARLRRQQENEADPSPATGLSNGVAPVVDANSPPTAPAPPSPAPPSPAPPSPAAPPQAVVTRSRQPQAGRREPSDRDLAKHALGAVSTIVPIGVFAAGPDGRCWYVNQRLMDTLGFDSADTSGQSLNLAIPVADLNSQPTVSGSQDVNATSLLRISAPSAESAGADGTGDGGTDDGGTDGSDQATAAPTVQTTVRARVLPQVRPDGTVGGYIGIVVADDENDSFGGVLTDLRLLHASEPLIERLVDSTPDIVTVLNPDGSWRYSNAAAWRLLGYREEFDPQTGVFDVLHPDDVTVAADFLARLQAGELGPAEPFVLRVQGLDGALRYLENTADNLTDDPVIQGIVVRSRDITAQHEAHVALLEANERLSTLVASLHIAALVEDENRVIVLTNEAFLSLFELTGPTSKLIGRTLDEISAELTRRFGDPTRGSNPDRVTQILRERRRVLGDRIELTDGRKLERDYIPIYVDHDYRGHLWLFRDVTAQARIEAESSQLLQTQREENRRLVELDRVKASFLAELSHELRTPLTSILSFTELLRDGVGKDEPAEQVEFLDVITRNAQRLIRLVDDLVLLDRAETGVLPVDWTIIDIPSLIEEAVITFAPQAESKRISLEMQVGEGPPITGDAHRIAQVLDILLSNAVKFTPETGRIVVTATPAEAHWLISVADTGIGVPAAEAESLFERFYRASNARAARIPGSGLGLSVARAIARMHHGEIKITSKETGGTTVRVAIPIGEIENPDERPSSDD